MSLGLSAPAAVPVELRVGDRRVFRLSREIGAGGIRLERPAPFEPGRPVSARFCLPGSTTPIELTAEVVTLGDESEAVGDRGGVGLYFFDPQPDVAYAIALYLADRLGLPVLTARS